jgi:diguanylate cyclase (GGDEF)-like protein
VKFTSLPPERLFQFLHRRRRGEGTRARTLPDTPLDAIFTTILAAANEFVPSSAGSILLDDPATKRDDASVNRLVFVACFGERSETLVGQEIASTHGIVGRVYRSGQPYLSRDPRRDPYFYEDIDARIDFETRTILCVPIAIGTAVCGALELLNATEQPAYGPRDLDLLSVFAGYISSSLQNAMDARLSQELARRDDLTGLFNDRYLHHELGHRVDAAIARSAHLSLLFLDLDWFKDVNDQHGHLTGSRVLREVGALLGRTLPAGMVPARYGGDEFVVICPGIDEEQACALAEDVREVIARTAYAAGTGPDDEPAVGLRGVITCSVGVASLRDLGLHESADTASRQSALLRAADTAMYRAKADGKNRVVCAVPTDLTPRVHVRPLPLVTPPGTVSGLWSLGAGGAKGSAGGAKGSSGGGGAAGS